MRKPERPKATQIFRCAIYTRKSSDDGLEQEFNSLDAQREACEAFIVSQRHAGWIALPDMYDDGGLSGGTMERPALQRLLADIKAGKIQIIVVYKVDRLTRSLADFAKIVDVLDAHGASFVSVTPPSHTTTSMGRLTLNMLLSFAQFEREIAGERIRDKIAASKAKACGWVRALGDDPFESESACMLQHGWPVHIEMLAEANGRAGRQDREELQQAFTVHEYRFRQIEPFAVKNIEDEVAEPVQAAGFQIGLQIMLLSWDLCSRNNPPVLRVQWREENGPPGALSASTGYGTVLIDQGIPRATVHREFGPEGLLCTIEVPLSEADNGRGSEA
jgi:predicted site-specific integrase-resolvase